MKRAVYTAVTGGYEAISDQPVAKDSSASFICFTDTDPSLIEPGLGWTVIQTDLLIPWDPTRSARLLKARGHPALAEFDQTLWIDNRIRLLTPPEDLLGEWLADPSVDMALPNHSYRETVDDEFQAVLFSALDDPARVRELRYFLSQSAPRVLAERPYWTAMIARRAGTTRATQACDLWADLILRHSRRDQLTINFALRQSGVSVNRVDIDNASSRWHDWLNVDRLPKNKDIRFSTGFKYGLGRSAVDRAQSSRPVRYLRSRFAKGF